jgi:hypothetical protein
MFREMGKLLGIDFQMGVAYYPQTDEETECVNQELEAYLRIYCGNNLTGWEPMIAILEFAHNNHVHETTRQTSFFLMGGCKMKSFPLPFLETTTPLMEQWLIRLQKARDKALAAYKLA